MIDFNTVNEEDYDITGGRRYNIDESQNVQDDDLSKLKVANLPQSHRPFAMQLVPYFGGEMIPSLLYASKWNLREKGVQEFTQEMEKAFETSRNVKVEATEKEE